MKKYLSLKPAAVLAGITLLAGTAIATPAAATPTTTTAAATQDFDASWTNPAEYSETQLATNGQEGFPNYRIPALAVAPNGDILASYDGRPTGGDSPGPNSILQRRSTDNGKTWGPQTVIRAGKTTAPIQGFSDPSYIVDRETGDIFNFHVFSQDVGFWGGQSLDNGNDRKIMHANVSRSTDNGHTWTHQTITSDITPDRSWTSRFAASGHGIQLKYGEYAGRLVQQFTIINGSGTVQAVSAYSDDHGITWQSGEPVGAGMDENKTVELSDGRVMLNSRDSHGSKLRKITYSTDGGHTYGPVTLDKTLIDPTNNAGITRAFPNAETGTPESKILLFSNAASQSSRSNGTVRLSCDNGQTWPVAKTFQEGGMAYSTMATLPDGNIGLLYEPNGGNGGIRFATFNLQWLGGLCAGITVDEAQAEPGQSTTIPVTVANQTSSPITGNELQVDLPQGWTGGNIALPNVAANESVTVQIPVTVPQNAYPGEHELTVRLGTAEGTVKQNFVFTVTPPAGTVATIVPQVTGLKEFYNAGDVLKINYKVKNWSDQTISLIPTGNMAGFSRPTSPNCGYQNLAAGASYSCTTATYTVTETDLQNGSFTPQGTWSVRGGNYNAAELVSLQVDGPAIELPRAPLATVTAKIVEPKEQYNVGDIIKYTINVKSHLNKTIAVVPSGNLEGFNRPTAPNCGWRSLAPNGSYDCTTAQHTVTAQDALLGEFTPQTQWVIRADNYDGAEIGSFEYVGPTSQVAPATLVDIQAEVTSAPQKTYAVGDTITYKFSVKNLTEETLSLEPTGNLTGFSRPEVPNCGYQNLNAGATYTCDTAQHTVTAQDLQTGKFTPETQWKVFLGSYSGKLVRTLDFAGPTVELPKKGKPNKPGKPEKPGKPKKPGKPNKPGKPEKPSKPSKPSKPKK